MSKLGLSKNQGCLWSRPLHSVTYTRTAWQTLSSCISWQCGTVWIGNDVPVQRDILTKRINLRLQEYFAFIQPGNDIFFKKLTYLTAPLLFNPFFSPNIDMSLDENTTRCGAFWASFEVFVLRFSKTLPRVFCISSHSKLILSKKRKNQIIKHFTKLHQIYPNTVTVIISFV